MQQVFIHHLLLQKTELAFLKFNLDKLDIDKLAAVPVDLSKLSNVVENDVVQKDVYNVKNIRSKILIIKYLIFLTQLLKLLLMLNK